MTIARRPLLATGDAYPALHGARAVEEQRFDSADVPIRSTEARRDKPVVLVHGCTVDAGVSGALPEDFRVDGRDTRGHGRGGEPYDPAGIIQVERPAAAPVPTPGVVGTANPCPRASERPDLSSGPIFRGMTESAGSEGFTDAEWAVWEPLIEAVRPRGKTPPKDLRRTIAAIFWRHRNGATWRAVPAELGPWWLAAQLFIRWAEAGVWERLLELAQEHAGGPELGLAFLDGTNVRAHAKAAGALKKGGLARAETSVKRLVDLAAAGALRAKHGFARAVAVADARGRAIAFALAPGQAHELPHAPALLDGLPDAPGWVVADRGFASERFRQEVRDRGATPAIPPKRGDAPVRCPAFIYRHRNRVERLWGRLKEWRAVATRYEKTARSFMALNQHLCHQPPFPGQARSEMRACMSSSKRP